MRGKRVLQSPDVDGSSSVTPAKVRRKNSEDVSENPDVGGSSSAIPGTRGSESHKRPLEGLDVGVSSSVCVESAAVRRRNQRRRRELENSDAVCSSSMFPSDLGRQNHRQSSYRATALRTAARRRQSSSGQITESLESEEAGMFSSFYIDLGDCVNVCDFCKALFWTPERLMSHVGSSAFTYSTCCKKGKVKLDYPTEPPALFKELVSDYQFLPKIRGYNSMFAMTSFGANIDYSVRKGGPFVFKIMGQISHTVGSLCPESDAPPRFIQMYIFDSENEVRNRLNIFKPEERVKYSEEVISRISNELSAINEHVKLFKSCRDLCLQQDVPEFCVNLFAGRQPRTYENPTSSCIGAIVLDQDVMADEYDIIVYGKGGRPQRVSKLHPSYMPLQYPLLFPKGEPGWSSKLTTTVSKSSQRDSLTMNMYYAYQIHERDQKYSYILKTGRLFQQYLVDAYVSVEQYRLDYHRKNQNTLRVDYLSGLHDAISRGDTDGREIGKRIILPSSFTGGPRYMYKHYQDALAICRVFGNPQYFITFTCNVGWPEIKRELQRCGCRNAEDRPDIIARVFRMKVDSLVKFLKEQKPFGDVTADLHTIEFQKRGLPHCHILLWVATQFKIHCPADVDRYISAELPDKESKPLLYDIVSNYMMHGPCGMANPGSPCMKEGNCSKKFPKSYQEATYFDDAGYAQYKRSRRCDNKVLKGKSLLDNGYVVPYNEILCLHFVAHINVEYCGWNMLIKYLFKYVSKGVDRIRFTVSKPSQTSTGDRRSQTIDEINNYLDGRFICPHEASWRLLNFSIHHRDPSVQVLAVHLDKMQNVTFRDNERLANVVRNPGLGKTTLTEWFRNNCTDPAGRDLTYVEYISRYRWDGSGRFWIIRTSSRRPSIGRLAYVHPACGELFYLRLLLNHQKGCRSYIDVRTVANHVYPTFREACEKLGLIGNDVEWTSTFVEASRWATASELRSLFTHMLLFCNMANPLAFWEEQWECMSDDIRHRLTQEHTAPGFFVDKPMLKDYILYELESLLKSNIGSSSLSQYGLPMPSDKLLAGLGNRLLVEEMCYDRNRLAMEYRTMKDNLRSKQLDICNRVIESVEAGSQILLFVYGYGGTGKTYLWTAITSELRSLGKIVLTVAASGVASLLLPAGRTAHSRFKIPLNLNEESICDIKKKTQLGQLIEETSLIIWDEAPMNERRCFESLDRALRDITGNTSECFGGKSVLLGGDFRQTLPVKKKASKTDLIALSLPRSLVWPFFKVEKLNENVRVMRFAVSSSEKAKLKDFAEWLLSIGNGVIGVPLTDQTTDVKVVTIPSEFLIPQSDHAIQDLISSIYDVAMLQDPSLTYFSDRAIVCPKNQTADILNDLILFSDV